jgi:hypothetical protein
MKRLRSRINESSTQMIAQPPQAVVVIDQAIESAAAG